MLKEDTWVTNVAEQTIRGIYRGVSVEIKEINDEFHIYLNSQFNQSIKLRSPVKATHVAKAAVDEQMGREELM